MLKKLVISFCLLLSIPASSQTVEVIKKVFTGGTGFYINSYGYAVTNEHVVPGCKEIFTILNDQVVPGSLIAADRNLDLAIVKFVKPSQYFAEILPAEHIKKGQAAYIAGYPLKNNDNSQFIIAATSILETEGMKNEKQWIQFASAAEHGNSGGPLLNDDSDVIGVIRAKVDVYQVQYTLPAGHAKILSNDEIIKLGRKVQSNDIAVSVPALRGFLDKHSVKYSLADSSISSYETLANKSTRFITRIFCQTQ